VRRAFASIEAITRSQARSAFCMIVLIFATALD
jgi:hypothetical protein